MRNILIDTGPLVAILSGRDASHRKCVEVCRKIEHPLLTCWPVLTEAAWMLKDYGPEVINRLLKGFSEGLFSFLPLDASDIAPISSLMKRYQKLGLQLADASLLRLAQRERISTLFTLDRRDFTAVRLPNHQRLTLIP